MHGTVHGSRARFALTQSAAAALAVFAALGLGMALPYVLLAWFPEVAGQAAASGTVDGQFQAGSGVPDVCHRGLAGLGSRCRPALTARRLGCWAWSASRWRLADRFDAANRALGGVAAHWWLPCWRGLAGEPAQAATSAATGKSGGANWQPWIPAVAKLNAEGKTGICGLHGGMVRELPGTNKRLVLARAE